MNLETNYLGFQLRSPIVPSASPLTERLDNVKRLEDAGAGAIVFHSLFEEQLHPERRENFSRIEPGIENVSESIAYSLPLQSFSLDPEQYLEHLRRAKASVHVPIIASLNAHTEGGVDRIRRTNQTDRRGRFGTESLFRARGSKSERCRDRNELFANHRGGEGYRPNPGCG